MRLLGAGAIAATIGLLSLFADQVNIGQLHVDGFTVIGLQTRTENRREATPESRIGPLWERLLRQAELRRIEDRVDHRIIAAYSDYESDKDGPYTYVLGAKVSSEKNVPAGMVVTKVLSGDYAEFSGKYENAMSTVNLWQQIWSLEKPGQLQRAYKTDFEVYSGASSNGPPTTVDIYVGVRK